MPYMCWRLSSSMQWSVVSKAAERSKSVRGETLPESSARRMSFVTFLLLSLSLMSWFSLPASLSIYTQLKGVTVQLFRSVPSLIGWLGGHDWQSSRDPLPVSSHNTQSQRQQTIQLKKTHLSSNILLSVETEYTIASSHADSLVSSNWIWRSLSFLEFGETWGRIVIWLWCPG